MWCVAYVQLAECACVVCKLSTMIYKEQSESTLAKLSFKLRTLSCSNVSDVAVLSPMSCWLLSTDDNWFAIKPLAGSNSFLWLLFESLDVYQMSTKIIQPVTEIESLSIKHVIKAYGLKPVRNCSDTAVEMSVCKHDIVQFLKVWPALPQELHEPSYANEHNYTPVKCQCFY